MRKCFIIVVGFSFLAVAGTSTARAEWGCKSAARDGYTQRTWGNESRRAAVSYTMQLCTSRHSGCRIVECRAGIDTQADAEAAWPASNRPTFCIGDAKC